MSKRSVREAGLRRRDPEKEGFWRAALSRQRHSGLGVPAFCEAEGLKATAFYFWRREIHRRHARQRRRVKNEPRAVPTFVELRRAEAASLPPGPPEAPIEVLLAHGRRVLVRSGCDVALLGRVVAVLEGEPC
jgi:hypothetical protein